MERDAFLARLHTAQGEAVLPRARSGPLYPKERRKNVVPWFIDTALGLGATIHRASSADDVRELIRTIARDAGESVFTSWADSELPVRGVASYLTLGGLEEVVVSIPTDSRRDTEVLALDRIGLGITGADAAFARSGAIAVFTGPGRPRMASLVPEVHVAILPEELIVGSFSMWAEANPDALSRSSNLVLIAGPSRSGPRSIHIIIV
jgi:L-lactate utilization protein LutC